MSIQTIEGTWEEIKRHDSDLQGRYVRLTVQPKLPTKPVLIHDEQLKSAKTTTRVSAMGKYAGILSTAEYSKHKQEEIDLEDRPRL